MTEKERILMECRYLLSLNKNYYELSKMLQIDEKIIYYDLNYNLKKFDTILYKRVCKFLEK